MKLRRKRLAISLLGALAVVTAPQAPVRAQAARLQYVVIYGELVPTAEARREGTRLLDHLAGLAARAPGVLHFSVNAEIERRNFFTLIEVWQDSASYQAFAAASDTQQALRTLESLLIAPLDERDGDPVQ